MAYKTQSQKRRFTKISRQLDKYNELLIVSRKGKVWIPKLSSFFDKLVVYAA